MEKQRAIDNKPIFAGLAPSLSGRQVDKIPEAYLLTIIMTAI